MKGNVAIGCSLMLIIFAVTSCNLSEKTLYSWDKYEEVSYKYSKDPSEKNRAELDKCFDKMLKKQNGTRKTVPPGICAERAYLLVKQNKKSEAIALLNQEIKLYPESKPFIDKIIKQIEQ